VILALPPGESAFLGLVTFVLWIAAATLPAWEEL